MSNTISIASFTNTDQFSKLSGKLDDGSFIVINNEAFIHRESGLNVVTNLSENKGMVAKLSNYLAPTTLALDSIDSIGKEFDKIIDSTFLSQTLHIKGTDILCSVFCLVVSMLPCDVRNGIYEAIQQIKRSTAAAGQAVAAINELVRTVNAVTGTINNLSNSPGISSAALAGSTIAASITSVKSIVGTLENVLKVINGAQLTPSATSTNKIWNLTQNVLFGVQAMVMGMADEILNKIVSPIENLLKDFYPSECISKGPAAELLNRILGGISKEKNWVINQIGGLFSSAIDFGMEFDIYNKGSIELIQLEMNIQALHMVSTRFGDLAIACGIAPCIEPNQNAILAKAAISQGKPIDIIPTKVSTNPTDQLVDNLDDIAKILAPIVNANIVANNDNLRVQYSLENIPNKLQNAIKSGLLDNLGSDYSLLMNNNDVNVTYTFKRMCGSGE